MARHPERAGELTATVQVVRAATAVILCAPALFSMWLLGYDAWTMVLAVTLILAWLPSYFAMAYSWVFRGIERMDYDALISVVQKFLTLTVSIICLALGGRVLGLILISILTGGGTYFVAMFLYRKLELPRYRVSLATARELMAGGAPMLAHAVAVAMQPYLNANLLYKLAPVSVVGWYGVAWTIGGTLVAPSVILSSALYPRFSRAADDPRQFQRVLGTALRPLLLIAMLGSVGTYLFADVAIAILYTEERFGEAASILRVFAPILLLIYLDMLFGAVLFAVGKAGRLAGVKFVAVLLTTGIAFVFIPIFQERFGNGGMAVMLGLGVGELLMLAASAWMVRDTLDRGMLVDVLRAIAAAAVTIAIMRWLPAVSPFIAIPACILTFLAASFGLGLVNRTDVQSLGDAFRMRRQPGASTEDETSAPAA